MSNTVLIPVLRFQYRRIPNTGIEKMGILEALDPAGNAKKDSNIKVGNFWQKRAKSTR